MARYGENDLQAPQGEGVATESVRQSVVTHSRVEPTSERSEDSERSGRAADGGQIANGQLQETRVTIVNMDEQPSASSKLSKRSADYTTP